MFKVLLITISGLLLIGCTGQMPESAMLVEAVRSVNAATIQQGVSPDQGQPVPTEAPTVEARAEETTREATSEEDAPDMNTSASDGLPGVPLFTFAGGEPRWYSVDDNVMGGISDSTVAIAEPDILAFVGSMSLENNGGFASARSEWQTVDLSNTDGILLRVFGDGNAYRLRIRTDTTERNISYNALFETTPGQWQTVYVPYDTMVPTYFGYVMDVGPIDRANIGSFGFMLSDEQPGEFELFVDWVRAVSEDELMALGG